MFCSDAISQLEEIIGGLSIRRSNSESDVEEELNYEDYLDQQQQEYKDFI